MTGVIRRFAVTFLPELSVALWDRFLGFRRIDYQLLGNVRVIILNTHDRK